MTKRVGAVASLVLSAFLLACSVGQSPQKPKAATTRTSEQNGGVLIRNVALHKPARQIDTLDDRGLPERAVDGNTDGHFDSESTTHTLSTDKPWWEVDLLSESQIFSLHIFNRVDCCRDRLINYGVEFYDYAYRLVSTVHYKGPPQNEYAFALHPPVVARYVRVQQRLEVPLSLAEVKVFGRTVGGHQNVAVGKTATQSSTYSHSVNPIASKAVDGNTDGNFDSGASTTHTNEEENPWWNVDLGQAYQITAITLWNRVDCCGDRLNNFQIILSEDGETAVKTFSYSSGSSEILPFTVDHPIWAQYVKVQILGSGILSLAEVQVFTGHVNLALFKTALQSTSAYNTVAGLAVDGNRDGDFSAGSVTHTQAYPRQWWEVDLGCQSEISSVSLYNRVDCCQDRLTNFEVHLFDFAHSLVYNATHGSDEENKYDFELPPATAARYVRVQLLGTDALSLAEVEVYGTLVRCLGNVAFQKPANQSSTLSHSVNPVAGKAVDGNINGFFTEGFTTHTNSEAGAWWEVDLGREFYITDVAIFNRIDCCEDRLQNFDVILSNSDGTEVRRFEHGLGEQEIFTFSLTQPSRARFVKVQLRGNGVLSLAEVQVFSGRNCGSGTAACGKQNKFHERHTQLIGCFEKLQGSL